MQKSETRVIQEPAKTVPVRAEYDVLVVGAGLVGSSFAVALADCGLSVGLVEPQPPRPVPDDYTSGSFKSRDDYVKYRDTGSLMISGKAAK